MMRRQEENHRHQDQQSRVLPRTVGAGSESYTIAADAFRRSISGAGVEVSPPVLIDDDDISGGIRLADARDIGFVDVVWIGRSILCYAMAPPPSPRKDIPVTFDGIGIASLKYDILLVGGMEGFVKRKGGWGKESGCLKRMEQHWSCCEGATYGENEFSRFLRVLMQEMWISLCIRC
ncbi:hypothetical protein GOBAR_DD11300 [Gossypium barbadense]|nr:hypothetical protein GOBAR_DD11300 [Gossypium barbadense]